MLLTDVGINHKIPAKIFHFDHNSDGRSVSRCLSFKISIYLAICRMAYSFLSFAFIISMSESEIWNEILNSMSWQCIPK